MFSTPDRVEFVGGFSKFPIFDKVLRKYFDENITTISHSMNPDESATLGALYYEAVQSKILYGVKLNITKKSLYGYSIVKGGSEASLFSPWTNLKMCYIHLQSKEDFQFYLKYNKSDKIDIHFDRDDDNFNDDDFMTINVNGLTEISQTQKLKSDNFIVNATFDYDKKTDTFDLASLKTSNFVDGKKTFWELGYEEYLTDSCFTVPSKMKKIVTDAIQSFKTNKKVTIAQKLLVMIFETLHRIKYDSDYEIVTTFEERLNTSHFLHEVMKNLSLIAKNPKEIKATHNRVELKLRSQLLRADERKERPGAILNLQAAIERAEEALPTATTDETAIQRFTEYFNITKIWKQVAENVEPLQNPVLLSQDIYRRANTLLGKIPGLYGPKRHVTHFKTPPPYQEPENYKAKNKNKKNSTNINQTDTQKLEQENQQQEL